MENNRKSYHKKKLKQCKYEFFAESKAHGLSKIVKNDNWFLKITWFCHLE